MSGPLAGLFSDQALNASVHSAAIRTGTVHDGHIQITESLSSRPPSWMVDPLCQQSLPPSLADRESQRNSRTIRRPRHTRDASTAQAPMSSYPPLRVPHISNRLICAGGHSGPPLRRGLVSKGMPLHVSCLTRHIHRASTNVNEVRQRHI